jgi:aspartate racemase
MKAQGVEVMVPDADDRTDMHNIIFNELCAGTVLETSRTRAMAMIEKAKAAGADSIILGCTEICLLLDPDKLCLPGVDSTTVHAQAAVDFAFATATDKVAA